MDKFTVRELIALIFYILGFMAIANIILAIALTRSFVYINRAVNVIARTLKGIIGK